MSISFSLKRIFLSSTFFFLPLSNSFAWDGYDIENNVKIEIGSGNLVREGNIITIYDWDLDRHLDVTVESMDESFNGTRLEVVGIDDGKNRVFEME